MVIGGINHKLKWSQLEEGKRMTVREKEEDMESINFQLVLIVL